MEYLLSSYTGGVGKFVMDTYNGVKTIANGDTEEGVKRLPVINRAVKPYNEEKTFYSKFYELKSKIDSWENSVKQREKAIVSDGTLYNPAMQDYLKMMTSPKGIVVRKAKNLEGRIEDLQDVMKKNPNTETDNLIKKQIIDTKEEIDNLIKEWEETK